MNFTVLTAEAMVANSHAWLSNELLLAALQNHALGTGILQQIRTAHGGLAEAVSRRKALRARLANLTRELGVHDGDHDRYARALHGVLSILIDLARTEAEIAALRNARTLLFPDALHIVQRSYVEEHGAVVEIEGRITPEVRELLDRTRFGDGTLGDLFRAWVEAGHTLGRLTQERARLQSSLGRHGEERALIDTRRARSDWIQVARVFLGIIELLPLTQEERRDLLAPMERSIIDVLRNRVRGAGDEPAEDGDIAGEQGEQDEQVVEDEGVVGEQDEQVVEDEGVVGEQDEQKFSDS